MAVYQAECVRNECHTHQLVSSQSEIKEKFVFLRCTQNMRKSAKIQQYQTRKYETYCVCRARITYPSVGRVCARKPQYSGWKRVALFVPVADEARPQLYAIPPTHITTTPHYHPLPPSPELSRTTLEIDFATRMAFVAIWTHKECQPASCCCRWQHFCYGCLPPNCCCLRIRLHTESMCLRRNSIEMIILAAFAALGFVESLIFYSKKPAETMELMLCIMCASLNCNFHRTPDVKSIQMECFCFSALAFIAMCSTRARARAFIRTLWARTFSRMKMAKFGAAHSAQIRLKL